MQQVIDLQVVDVFTGDDVDFGVPLGIEHFNLSHLLALALVELRKVFKDVFHRWLVQAFKNAVVTLVIGQITVRNRDFGFTHGLNSQFVGKIAPRHTVLVKVEIA